jgi:lantibiotic modifying enzyme
LMDRALGYIQSLSPMERLRKAGVLSGKFWLATYKPRALDIEEHFQRLLEWLNERGDHPPFKALRILNQGAYGWVEFIAAEGCTSEEGVRRFFERQGGYLALLYSLEATDFHFENLIASGEHPVLVDLEALFHPIMGFEGTAQSPTAASDVINHSVLRVGILPRRRWINEESDGVDLAASEERRDSYRLALIYIWKE